MKNKDLSHQKSYANSLYCANSLFAVILTLLLLTGSGCGKSEADGPPKLPPPRIRVAEVVQETVPEFFDYVGNTESVLSVEIRARVEGFLQKRLFDEGADVEAEQMLYVIEKRQYEANLDERVAELQRNTALARDAKLEEARFVDLFNRNSTSASERDSHVARAEAAAAQVEFDKASLNNSEITLSYCSVYSPIAGRVGRTHVHVGNLVGNGEATLLTTVVQLDPIYIVFSPSTQHLGRILEKQERGETIEVEVSLPDTPGEVYHGTINFVNNEANPQTATVLLRGVIDNPNKVLLPGLFVEVRRILDHLKDQLLIPSVALVERLGGQFVFVVDEKNVCHMRKVVPGATYGHLRLIQSGLKPGERISVDPMRLKDGIQVVPTLIQVSENGIEDADNDVHPDPHNKPVE